MVNSFLLKQSELQDQDGLKLTLEANLDIEIELKGMKGQPNLVIRRLLTATNKSSSFLLNGKSSTGKEVTEKMKALNVQVGNLW